MKKYSETGGYIALMTTVILGLVMLTLLVVVSNIGFSGRFNILDAELKEVSINAAHSCIETTFLKIAQDPFYPGTVYGDIVVGKTFNEESNIRCAVLPREDQNDFVHVRVEVDSVFTNLQATSDGLNLQECQYFENEETCILP